MVKFTPLKLLGFFVFIVPFANCFSQGTSTHLPKSKYTFTAIKFDEIVNDMFYAPNYGLFVANGNKLSLLNGKDRINIPYKIGIDTLGSGSIGSFRRDPKYYVYFQTRNYTYRLGKTIDTIYTIFSKNIGYSMFLNDQNVRKYNYAYLLADCDELVYLKSKGKSGIVVKFNSLCFYNNFKNELTTIPGFKNTEIISYINLDSVWYVVTQNFTYKITVREKLPLLIEKIKDPIENIKDGKIIKMKGMHFFLCKSGLFLLHFKKDVWESELLLNSSQIKLIGDGAMMDLSPDLSNIFFTNCQGEVYHFHKSEVSSIELASLNSIFIWKNKYIFNNSREYDAETGKISFNDLLDGYNNDYSAIGKNNFLINYGQDTIETFNEILHKQFYKRQKSSFSSRFIVYKNKIIGAGRGKIFSFDKEKQTYFPIKNYSKNDLPFDFCYSLLVVNDILYLGSESGLITYNFNTGLLGTIKDLPFKDIRTLKYDKDLDAIFVFSYGNGPFLLTNGKVKRLTLDPKRNLLFAHNLVQINNLAYLSSNNGIYVVPFKAWIESDQNNSPIFYRIDKLDGLPSNECNSGSIHSLMIDSLRGRLLFSTVEGVGIVPYLEPIINWPLVAPKIITTNYSNQTIYGAKDTFENYSNLEFEVSIPYFGLAENIHIEYKIGGLIDQWTPLTGSRLNLPENIYGNYTLELRVSSGFDTYQTSKYTFYFVPKFTQTVFFKVLLLAALIALILIVILVVKRIEKKKRIQLQALVDEKTHDLHNALDSMTKLNIELGNAEKVKENLVSVLAHDMRSPLMSVVYTVDHLIRNYDLLDDEETRVEILNEIKFSITKITQFSTEFLKWYALSRGGFKLTIEKQSLSELVLSTTSFYDKIIKRDGNSLVLKLEEEMFVLVDSEIFKIVFRNLVDNANKYCENKIIVETKRLNNLPVLVIKNNYSSENEFPVDFLRDKIKGKDVILNENEQFKFGLSIISQMAKITNIQIVLEYEKPWVSFTLLIPEG
ncbi:MAG: hypothetical protein CFE21_02570 [Bacteroidetes bacterium B1(2017)]|nr:MAG: hypothetical protein CFE21_02570 [Bacteroidetes bacterium B1(2017)]